jgi:hypothetical protein
MKKYRVHMENGEVLSVEVDRVRYPHLEDIPDEHDRQKVHRLIARRTGVEAAAEVGTAAGTQAAAQAAAQAGTHAAAQGKGTGFAESFSREFEADLRELRKNATQGTKLILFIFLGVASIVLTVAAFSTLHVLRIQAREEEAPGRVVDLVVRTRRDSTTQETVQVAYPVVEFAVPGQHPQTAQMAEGSSPPAYAIGDEVTVVYDAQQPGRARIKSLSSTLLRWLVPAISAVVGTAFVLAAILAVRLGGEPSY